MRLAPATLLLLYVLSVAPQPALPFTSITLCPPFNNRSHCVISRRIYHGPRSSGSGSGTSSSGTSSSGTSSSRAPNSPCYGARFTFHLGDVENSKRNPYRRVRSCSVVVGLVGSKDTGLEHDSGASSNPQSPLATRMTASDSDDHLGELVAGASSEKLKRVVAQLRGEIKAGSIPQMRSRVALDDLFAELHDEPTAATGTDIRRIAQTATAGGHAPGTATPSAAASTFDGAVNDAGSKKGKSPPPKAESAEEGIAGSGGGGDGISSTGGDLESLSDMLSRLQSSAQARDLAEAGARAAALRSGVPIGESFSALIASTHNEMRTRFASIREGRVSWAVLPLILRARHAGIQLSTGVYNAAISAYISTPRKYQDALRVLDLLRDSGDTDVLPDISSYNTAMRVCGAAGKWRVVTELMEQMKKEGIEPTIVSYNHLLDGLAKCREWYRARRVFRRMVRDGIIPDLYSYNGLVEAAGMGSMSPRRNMIQIVHEMEQAGVEPTAYTFTLLLDCLALRRKVFDGFQVTVRLVDARVPMLPRGYRAGLLFCKDHGDWRRAMILMEDMRVAGKRPSGVMYLMAVQACAEAGQWERALSLMVERRALVARDAKEAATAASKEKSTKRRRKDDDDAQTRLRVQRQQQLRAEELDMKTLEAVLTAVSAAGQFEVAIRLVQQIRSAGAVPTKTCYLCAMRAAAKWGRWDVIEGLLKDMRMLGVGVESIKSEARSMTMTGGNTLGEKAQNPDRLLVGIAGGKAEGDSHDEGGERAGMRLTPDCFTYLIEAYAQVSMWERAIDAFNEGFVVDREDAPPPASYRVYECVLKACVGAGDGRTALEIIRRQASESPWSSASERSRSGGPPDRRCWCLAAEALGRAGMINEGHDVLRAMVKSGIPLRESTKKDVPSVLPLPTGDGFEWHRRKRTRRRHRRRPIALRLSSSSLTMRRREAAIRLLLDPTAAAATAASDGGPAPAYVTPGGGEDNDDVGDRSESDAGMRGGGEGLLEDGGVAAVESRKWLGLGWLLVSDWRFRNSELRQEVESAGVRALERKRQRMRDFSRKERETKLEDEASAAEAWVDRDHPGTSGGGGGKMITDDRLSRLVEKDGPPRTGLDLRPGGRRGRNEALSLWMRYQRTPGIVGRGTQSRSSRPEQQPPRERGNRRRRGGGGGGGQYR